MALTIKRKSRQNSDQLLLKFNRQTTRFVRAARNNRFLESKASPFKKRTIAVIREKHRRENERRRHYE